MVLLAQTGKIYVLLYVSHMCCPIKNYEQLGYGSKQPHYHLGLFHRLHLNNSVKVIQIGCMDSVLR